MQKRAKVVIVALVAVIFCPQLALGATWTVEKDGSGDFTIVQDALDAAAPGDSILIGPGRFDTFRPGASVVDGVPFASIAWITTSDLTLIGAGRDQTILGPSVPVAEEQGLGTASLIVDSGAVTSIQEIGFENTRWIVTLREQCVIEDCRVTRVKLSSAFAITILDASGVEIRRTEVIGPDGIITGPGTSGLLVEDCVFDDDSFTGVAVGLVSGAQDCTVRGCTFLGGAEGVQFSGTGLVEDCRFEGMEFAGIDVSGGSAVVRACYVGMTRQTLRVGQGRLEVYDTFLGGGTQATIASWATVIVRNSHILNGGPPTVRGRTSAAGQFIDLRYNWWGTTDVAQIEAWIDDPYGTVTWQPIADAPVPTKSSSVGALKGRFRGSGEGRN